MIKKQKYNSAESREEFSFSKEQVFRVPEGYFETLPDQIMNKIKEDKNQKTIIVPIYRKPIFIYAAALLIIMIAVSGILFLSYENNKQNAYSPDEITITDLYDTYFDQSMDEYTLQTYYARSLDENANTNLIKASADNDSSITHQAIETYLLESYDPENILNH